MKKIIFIIGLLLCSVAQANSISDWVFTKGMKGEFSFLVGQSWLGKADDGTYNDSLHASDIRLVTPSAALRYDARVSDNYGVAVQATYFGTATIRATAVTAEAPAVGGYDRATKSCVGGTCGPTGYYMIDSETQSVAFFMSRRFGNWSAELGANLYEIRTSGRTRYQSGAVGEYPTNTYLDVGPAAGLSYRSRSWSTWAQVWPMEGRGGGSGSKALPSVSTGVSYSLMVGYRFWE